MPSPVSKGGESGRWKSSAIQKASCPTSQTLSTCQTNITDQEKKKKLELTLLQIFKKNEGSFRIMFSFEENDYVKIHRNKTKTVLVLFQVFSRNI